MALFTNELGEVWTQTTEGDTPVENQNFTTGIVAVSPSVRPIGEIYKGNLYLVGQYTRPLIFDSVGGIWAQGIPKPAAPAIALDSGSGGDTGESNVGYITFGHRDLNGQLMAESNPVEATGGPLTSDGTGFTWSSIPTVAMNPRVNVVRGWRSVDGEIAALAWERDLGATTVTENVLTLDLGPDTLPVKAAQDGTAEVDFFQWGVLPYVTMVAFYGDCAWYAGDPKNPGRVYRSLEFYPEAVNVEPQTVANDKTFFETKDGEQVTGLKRHGDELIVLCPNSVYSIQAFGPGDYAMRKISNYYGCISRWSPVLVGPNSDLWFMGAEGKTIYNGQFRFAAEDIQDYYRDLYAANVGGFERAFSVEDRYSQTAHFYPVSADAQVAYYRLIGHYIPVSHGDQPWWVLDTIGRGWSAAGVISDPGQLHQDLYTGACDGYVRKENVEDDADDDGDSGLKAMDFAHKHQYFGDQSGDSGAGHTYVNLDVFLKNDDQPATVYIYAGPDTAYAQGVSNPTWSETIPAGAETPARVVPTSASLLTVECTGEGETLRFRCESPVRVEYRGYGILYQDLGVENRGQQG